MYKRQGLANRLGVIILYVVFYLPINLMLYVGYLKSIPLSLEEAASIDGASTWMTYWRVIFPLMKPRHATVEMCIRDRLYGAGGLPSGV